MSAAPLRHHAHVAGFEGTASPPPESRASVEEQHSTASAEPLLSAVIVLVLALGCHFFCFCFCFCFHFHFLFLDLAARGLLRVPSRRAPHPRHALGLAFAPASLKYKTADVDPDKPKCIPLLSKTSCPLNLIDSFSRKVFCVVLDSFKS